jgi:Spy/CpxP family protein refolding chaperone
MHRTLSLALALVTAGLAATATPASAQQKDSTVKVSVAKPDSGMYSANPAERLLARKTELNLTDRQVKKLEDLKTKFAGKTTPADTGRAAWRAHRGQMKEAMAVLTDSQKQKLESMHASRRAHWKAQHDSLGHSHHGGTTAPADSTTH